MFEEKEKIAIMSKFSKSIFALLAIALLVSGAFAQVPTGKITGKVADKDGAGLPGVSISADSPKLVGSSAAVSDEQGVYRLFSLPAGTYSVRFTLPGFKTVTRREIVLQTEQTLTLNITLDQSALNEEVTVIGQSPLIDVKSTTKGSTMNKDAFMQLPRNRDFNGLLATVPGVQYEGNQGGLSVDGASGTENQFYVDGTNINNMRIGTQAQSIVMEQLEEVKVSASGYNAEFGGSMGGVINVISRSGGNEFHADAFGYYNNNKLWMQGKSRDALRINPYAVYPYKAADAQYYNTDDLYYNGGKNRDDYQRMEGVFNLSGFILKDKLWFFGSFNPSYARTYGDRFFNSDPVDLSQAKIPGDTVYDPRQGRQTYNFYQKLYYMYWQGKLTAAPLPGMRVSVSAVSNFYWYRGSIPGLTGTSTKYYSYRPDWNPINPSTNAGLLTSGKQPGFDYPNWSGNANVDYTFSNNFLVSLRGGYFFTNQNNQQLFVPGTYYAFNNANTQYAGILPADKIHNAGWSNGAGTTVTQRFINSRMSGNLDLTYYLTLAGEHAWKAGFQYIRLAEDVAQSPLSPLVNIYWDQPYYRADGLKIQGTYGYYTTRGDFVSPYGSNFNVASNNWAVYLQDSWTIGQRLTVNLGVRTESEYIPSLAGGDQASIKPIQFGFGKKLAPRLGAVYDVFGDSSLKIFGSFGIYYDVMKLYMAEGAYGGFKWQTSYYELNDPDWTKIASKGDITDKADIIAGNKYISSRNERTVSFDTTDPNLKPVSQAEYSFGAEKKINEELSFSARFVYKHLIRTIEDVGVLLPNPSGGFDEQYYVANPGEGWTLPISQGGRFDNSFWISPKAKREYLALNLALEKRFANNWQGGINYTWSQMKGNYGGLSSSDENGRNSPNVERYWDLYFERYDIHGNPLDNILPSDRTHYFKAYGSYAFPFGLTVGVVGYGRSGLPLTTTLSFNDMVIYPDNYFDTGRRTPFLFTADLYLEYNLRIAKKFTINLNATLTNFTNTSTINSYNQTVNYTMLRLTDDVLLAQKTNYVPWQTLLPQYSPVGTNNPLYNLWNGKNGPMSWRMGARVSF
jgi:hypothetical protein